jgi:hypothetical protein
VIRHTDINDLNYYYHNMNKQDEDELIKTSPGTYDEQSADGSMPNPEEEDEKDVLERAQEAGLYTDADEENPAELDIAKEVNDAEDYNATH